MSYARSQGGARGHDGGGQRGDGRGGSGGEHGGSVPSSWARRCFGEAAAPLAAAVPERLLRAHERALAAHLGAGLKRRGPYGRTLLEAAREELAEGAQALGGDARELHGYTYAVLNDHVLFPYKYADRPLPLGRARMPHASVTRQRLYHAHGPEGQEGLFPLDEELTSEDYEQLHEAFEELGRTARLVSVFFTADPEGGIHAVHWGSARLEPDHTFAWDHSEQLDIPART
ncbi:hypothetical protein [Streptomyces sp. CA-132043]|uniref:hypothetical protein n=1 Tax=Streptomyces sp. CA-132043 TaxID=3240048 RepID=UPI003D8AEB9C